MGVEVRGWRGRIREGKKEEVRGGGKGEEGRGVLWVQKILEINPAYNPTSLQHNIVGTGSKVTRYWLGQVGSGVNVPDPLTRFLCFNTRIYRSTACREQHLLGRRHSTGILLSTPPAVAQVGSHLRLFVCVSVCFSARYLKNRCT